MRTMKHRLAGVLIYTASTVVLAGAGCPGERGESIPQDPSTWQALAQELERHEADCLNSPLYLAYRGALLNLLGRPEEGGAWLERALLIHPDLVGAQIDYAESLIAMGQQASARLLLRDILARDDLPPHLRSMLASRLKGIAPPSPSAGQAWLGLSAGYDSNLNAAPPLQYLALTVSEGNITVPLADSSRARAGAASMLEVGAQQVNALAAGERLLLRGAARQRMAFTEDDTQYWQYQVAAVLATPRPDGRVALGAQLGAQEYGGNGLVHTLGLTLIRDWQRQGCQPRAEFELEQRQHGQTPELDGLFAGFTGGWLCGEDVYALRAGYDMALHDRAGGDIQRLDLRIRQPYRLAQGQLTLDALVSHQQDSEGYSPLLQNDARRSIQRLRLRLDYAWPISGPWEAIASIEHTRQSSNIPLFELQGTAAYLGLRWNHAW